MVTILVSFIGVILFFSVVCLFWSSRGKSGAIISTLSKSDEIIADPSHAHIMPMKIDRASVIVEQAFDSSKRDCTIYKATVVNGGAVYVVEKTHRDFRILYSLIKISHPRLAHQYKSIFTKSPKVRKMIRNDHKGYKCLKFSSFIHNLMQLKPLPLSVTLFLQQPWDDMGPSLINRGGDFPQKIITEASPVGDNEHHAQMGLSPKKIGILNSFVEQFDHSQIEKHLWPGDSVKKYCLRFLKARNFNLQNASTMLNADLKWRDEHNWKEKVKNSKPIDVLGLSFESLEKYLPIWHQGFDKIGRPVSIQRFGAVRLPILLAETTLDNITAFQVHHSEYLAELCGVHKVESWVIIIDAMGWDPMNLMNSNAFRWAKRMNELDAFHNPERLGQMLIINAPKVVYTFYSMISYLLDEVTAKKIQIFTAQEQWGPVLSELIEAEQLPPEFGGSGKNNLKREFSRGQA